MSYKILEKGIYLTVIGSILSALNRLSIADILSRYAKDTLGFSIIDSELKTKKAQPWVVESYQIIILALLIIALSFMPAGRSSWSALWWMAILLAHYRAGEIAVYSAKWLFVDRERLHSYRRSLISFLINLLEVSISMTILGLPSDHHAERWRRVWENLGSAFKLDGPALCEPYALWFSLEAGLLFLFLFACVIGGIQRDEL